MSERKSGKSTAITTANQNKGRRKTKEETALVERRRKEMEQEEIKHRRMSAVVLFAVGVLLILFVVIGLISSMQPGDDNLLDMIYMFLCGIFGFTVFFTGPIVIYVAILIATDKSRTSITTKVLQLVAGIVLLSTAIQIIFVGTVGENTTNIFEAIGSLYMDGIALKGGGIVGGLLAALLLLFGRVGAIVIISLVIFVFVMFLSRKTLMEFLGFVGKPVKKAAVVAKEKHTQRKEEMEILRLENERKNQVEAEKRKMKIAELEMATADNLHDPISRRQSNIMDRQRAESEDFINTLNEYNSSTDNSLKVGNDVLPDINYGSEVHTSRGDKLPDIVGTSDFDDSDPYILPDLIEAEEPPIPAMSFTTEQKAPVEEAIRQYTEEKREEKPQTEIEMAKTEIENQMSEKDISPMEQYILPPSAILDDPVQSKNADDVRKELEENATKIVEVLKSFGVQAKCIGACRGPSVTRYEIQPAAGVKISKITGLSDDIALNLAATGIRIEAPIPGKPAVGIEVPNKKTDSVPFRMLIESTEVKNHKSKLAAALGKDIAGDNIIIDIAEMPHLLVAGTTGSGKSVCMNTIIMSILFRSTPEEVRFIMIDPKSVEFADYNGIPHLLIPVVTNPKKAAGALAWAVTEMMRRYNLFSEYNVRNLQGYNSYAEKNPELKKLPQIAIFIDELSDLMMASKNEVEDSICRLAQMARAAGMHLIIATQRPTVDVVTGLIKANIPSRIALKVGSGVDSRVIIDEQGAEKLIGKGDMLLKTISMPKPKRVQGCWVSDKEVERVVNFIKDSFILEYDDDVINEVERQTELVRSNDKKSDMTGEGGDIDVNDEKLEEAIRVVVEAGQASTSSLQRRLKLGYGRAARLIDIMEEMGIVGPSEGSKPRQVLMTREQYYERQMNNSD
ncbi:MAG: DUF87 domain-containing protein [Ruminiclostridium sp.]|nr:DUF87 domain-containing protein [Ruminiclostridium sp.]